MPFSFFQSRPAPRESARSRSRHWRSCRSTPRRSSTRLIRIEMLGAAVAFTRATRLGAMARARTSHRTASQLAGCPVRPRYVARLSSRSRPVAPIHDVAAGTRELDSAMAQEPRARCGRLAEKDKREDLTPWLVRRCRPIMMLLRSTLPTRTPLVNDAPVPPGVTLHPSWQQTQAPRVVAIAVLLGLARPRWRTALDARLAAPQRAGHVSAIARVTFLVVGT